MKSFIPLTLAASLALFTQTLAAPLDHDILAKRSAMAKPLEAQLAAPETGLEARSFPPGWKREAEPTLESERRCWPPKMCGRSIKERAAAPAPEWKREADPEAEPDAGPDSISRREAESELELRGCYPNCI